jgi:dihydrofolate synthase/folylpolyglutamate synthase
VAEEAIRKIAAERHAPVVAVREEYGDDLSRYPHTNLEGDYQRWNAATATLAARLLPARWGLTDEVVARGLMRANWPGRWQRLMIGRHPLILDASHNPEGAQVLDANLTKLRAETGRQPVIMTGALGEYRARALLEVIARHAREIHLVVPHQARACGYAELEHCVPPTFAGRIARTMVDVVFPAPDRCTIGGDEETVVVTGSIYLIGEVFERLEPGRGTGEGRLQDF